MKKLHSLMRSIQGMLLSKIMLVVLLLTATVFFFQRCTREAEMQKESGETLTKKVASITSTALPGGRAYYAIALMGGNVSPWLNGWCRISQYTFTAGTGTYGTVVTTSQYWNQNYVGDENTWKVSSTFPTSGCTYNCTVRCPYGSEPASLVPTGPRPWSTVSGTYTLDVPNSTVTITWPSWGPNNTETWKITNPTGKAYTQLQIHTVDTTVIGSSNYGIQHGLGFGSNANFETGPSGTWKSLAQMKGTGQNLSNAEVWQNPYKAQNEHLTFPGTYFRWDIRQVCNTGVYIYPQTPVIACSSCTGSGAGGNDKNYVASSSLGNQGRITYNQYQLGKVGCADNCTNTCITPGGGHTTVSFQAIDDNGVYQGFVGVEASLGGTATRGRFAGCFYFLYP